MRDRGLALPPNPMPLLRGARPLKRWRYLGVFAPEAMLCAAEVAIGPLRQRFWALAQPGGELHGGTTPRSGPLLESSGAPAVSASLRIRSVEARIEVALDPPAAPPGVESVSPSGRRGYVWTRKQAGIPARLRVEVGGRCIDVDAEGVIDDTAGYHPRHTAWSWSAGVGRGVGGERVAWNLVEGINDSPEQSERTVWVDGEAFEPGPVSFAPDLSRVVSEQGHELRQAPWATREHSVNALLVRSSIRQPFGAFSGVLPGGLELSEGLGVMESHEAWW